jgi:hypothetical protein
LAVLGGTVAPGEAFQVSKTESVPMADKYDKCRTCAAMVADAYRHRQWHEALDLQSRKVEKRLRDLEAKASG